MEGYKKLTKKEINKLTKDLNKLIYIGDKTYIEEFKQVYYYRQKELPEYGIYLPYLISSFGRIFKIKSNYDINSVSAPIDKNGYNLIVLRYQNQIIGARIHRLVAISFIKNNNKLRNEVNHIDGIKTHNYIWNLEWCTSSENKFHARNHGLTNFARGEKSGKSIYNNRQIHDVCSLLESTELSHKDISNKTGVSAHIVNDIYKNRYWNHISSEYDFSKRYEKDAQYKNAIRNVCKMLEKNKSIKDIEQLYDINVKVISSILHKKIYKYISNDFDFSNYNYGK